MKAALIYLFLCVAAAVGFAADDPYPAGIGALPLQHSHGSAAVEPLTLAKAEQIALQTNPQIRLAVRKVAKAEAHVSGAGALDDPSFMYRGWQVPLSQPWNYNAAMNMFMVGQSFTGPGKRALRSQIAGDTVTVTKAELEATKRDVLAQASKAYYDRVCRPGRTQCKTCSQNSADLQGVADSNRESRKDAAVRVGGRIQGFRFQINLPAGHLCRSSLLRGGLGGRV